MLKKFVLKNYKNFEAQICLDFGKIAGYKFSSDCITDGLISKMMIYGRNATGKTNLGWAIMDLNHLVSTKAGFNSPISNANHINEKVLFSYEFSFDGTTIEYKYHKNSDDSLIDEILMINNSPAFYFDYMKDEGVVSNLIGLGVDNNDNTVLKNYIDMTKNRLADEEHFIKVCFLKWLMGNTVYANDSVLGRLSLYINRMRITNVSSMLPIKFYSLYDGFFDYLEDSQNLSKFESFLNEMGVDCSLVMKKLPDGNNELYFDYGSLLPFFPNASSGTRALVDLYRRLIFGGANKASFFYIDEFDAFYHYEMAENVLKYLKKNYPSTQIIITSHNTNLMANRLMRPDCLFILSGDGKLTALCEATSRELREGHNLEKMYISGEFEDYE